MRKISSTSSDEMEVVPLLVDAHLMKENTLLFSVLFLALIPIIAFLVLRPSVFGVLIKDSRPNRILHYLLMAVFGASLQVEAFDQLLEPWVLLRFALFFLLLFYAGQFAIVTNNVEDLPVDRITNPNRPLVQSHIAQRQYQTIASICLFITLSLSLTIGLLEFATISALSLVYFLYSAPPFKLKRYVFLAKFLIGTNSFFAALYGFVLMGGKYTSFPLEWGVFILVPISLMANFIDLKDTAGDRVVQVKTLPVILGQRKASFLIVVFAFITYLYAGILLHNAYISVLISLLCLFHIYLILRTPYKEGLLFILHNSLFFGLILLLLILK